MSWINSQVALAYFAGCMTGVIIYVCDWLWNVKIAPRRRKKHYPDSKTVNAALKENERRKRDERAPAPPPSRATADPSGRYPHTHDEGVEEDLRLDTADLPVTQEHPAPNTAMIDLSQPPPNSPYGGPERRFQPYNPYPELRRRAEDRERAEAQAAARPSPPPPGPRLTRAEERRRREAGNTESDRTDTDGE